MRAEHSKLIRELCAAGTVLLKNLNNILPLKKPRNIGVFGNDAADFTTDFVDRPAEGNYEIGALAAIKAR